MNLYQQLSCIATERKKSVKPVSFSRNKVRPEYKESEEKYRAFLLGEHRTIREIAEHMNMTYDGAHASIKRMISRKLVLVVTDDVQKAKSSRSLIVTWNPLAKTAKSIDEQYRKFFMGHQRTSQEFAKRFGLTIDGARSAIRRLISRKQIVKTRPDRQDGAVRCFALFSWSVDEAGNPVTAESFTKH